MTYAKMPPMLDRTLPMDPNAPPAPWNPNQPGRIHHMAGRIGMTPQAPQAPPPVPLPGPFGFNDSIEYASGPKGQMGPFRPLMPMGDATIGAMAGLPGFGRGLPSGRRGYLPFGRALIGR